ncbi:MAG: WYL domain-containing protein, partial [Bacteroidetes bacterium QS_1_65_9]
RPDGRLVVSFEASGLEEVGAFARSWGTSVRVLAPDELARQVAEEARGVAEAYEEDRSKNT